MFVNVRCVVITLFLHRYSARRQSSLWHSEGEIRFLLLKRAMDLYYASIGTAVKATRTEDGDAKEGWTGWKLPMAAAAAASYYSFFGTNPSKRALEAVASSSMDLIQYAWGMVSLPAVKQLSLQASRLLKGAAIAERITLCGVSCFVLSRDPSPGMNVAMHTNVLISFCRAHTLVIHATLYIIYRFSCCSCERKEEESKVSHE